MGALPPEPPRPPLSASSKADIGRAAFGQRAFFMETTGSQASPALGQAHALFAVGHGRIFRLEPNLERPIRTSRGRGSKANYKAGDITRLALGSKL